VTTAKQELQTLLDQFALKKMTLKDFKEKAMTLVAKVDPNDLVIKSNESPNATLIHFLVLNSTGSGNNEKELAELFKLNPELIKLKDGDGRDPLQALIDAYDGGRCTLEDFKRTGLFLATQEGINLQVSGTKGLETTFFHHLVCAHEEGLHEDAMKQLLKKDPELINHVDEYKKTPIQSLMNKCLNKYGILEDKYIEFFKKTALLLGELGADLTVLDMRSRIFFGHGSIDKSTLLHHLIASNKDEANNEAIEKTVTYQKAKNKEEDKSKLEVSNDFINVKNKDDKTPLQLLMSLYLDPLQLFLGKYDIKIIKITYSKEQFKTVAMTLVRKGADFTVIEEKTTLYHNLIVTNKDGDNEKELAELFKLNPNLINFKDGDGRDPLQALIDAYTDGRCTLEDFKRTGLFLATQEGINLKVSGTKGSKTTFFHHLVRANEEGQNDNEIKWLLNPIKVSITPGNHVKKLINVSLKYNESRINIKDINGNTPLHTLIQEDSSCTIEQIEKMLELGSDLKSKNNDGRSLIHAACIAGNLEVATYLASKGLKVKSKEYIETLLHCSVKHENEALWNWLLENKLDLNIVDHQGYTVLHKAIIEGNLKLIEWLIQNKVALNLETPDGDTPLNLAARHTIKEDRTGYIQAAERYQKIEDALMKVGAVRCNTIEFKKVIDDTELKSRKIVNDVAVIKSSTPKKESKQNLNITQHIDEAKKLFNDTCDDLLKVVKNRYPSQKTIPSFEYIEIKKIINTLKNELNDRRDRVIAKKDFYDACHDILGPSLPTQIIKAVLAVLNALSLMVIAGVIGFCIGLGCGGWSGPGAIVPAHVGLGGGLLAGVAVGVTVGGVGTGLYLFKNNAEMQGVENVMNQVDKQASKI
jgi:ankyrin repeat protein